jgi:deazaflavin-dependent oxidoreductase (nitroreductase family)
MLTEPHLRYLVPTRADRAFNRLVGALTRHGVSVAGSRVLTVRGRRSGEPRHTVVNVLDVDGARYLVAPRGETHWVRNLRAAGDAGLRVGRRIEEVTAIELDDVEKLPVLRAYLRRWAWEVGRFFEGLDADSDDEVLRAAAPGFPAFRLVPAP